MDELHCPAILDDVAGQSDPWYGDKSQSTLWEENKPAANRLHPTMKPVELVERALTNSSKAGDVVLDLFGGSGSTLIGCERRGRKARLMEIDPKYADCIVLRFEQFTGKYAVLEADGRSFEEVAQERRKRRRESASAVARSLRWKRRSAPANWTCPACAWRWPTSRRN